MALTLDQLGDTARRYAEVCRSETTHDLLRAWEAEDPTAWQRVRTLVDASGIVPPDTDLLAWGGVMGYDEARVRDRVATALEQATEDGRLTPGARGFRLTPGARGFRRAPSGRGCRQRTIEAAAEFERAIAAAERDGPSPDVHPSVHRAVIEAMRSELDVLREQLDTRAPVT